jgi:hypothetical protein
MTHNTLKRIIVGSVFLVEVQIRLKLETIANIYSHHHCFPNRRPGKIIAIFVEKPNASMMFTFVQYPVDDIVFNAIVIFLKNINFYDLGFSGKVTPIIFGESSSK